MFFSLHMDLRDVDKYVYKGMYEQSDIAIVH